jgi:hypothetical protein
LLGCFRHLFCFVHLILTCDLQLWRWLSLSLHQKPRLPSALLTLVSSPQRHDLTCAVPIARFHQVPLKLEWAPVKVFSGPPPPPRAAAPPAPPAPPVLAAGKKAAAVEQKVIKEKTSQEKPRPTSAAEETEQLLAGAKKVPDSGRAVAAAVMEASVYIPSRRFSFLHRSLFVVGSSC